MLQSTSRPIFKAGGCDRAVNTTRRGSIRRDWIQAASGRARISESLDESDFWSEYHLRGTAERTRVTWAAFVGLDQTNDQGIAGFLRAGYRFRNYGPMPARVTEWSASTSSTYDTTTIPLDYSGFFMSLGVGYDLPW